MPWHAHVRPPFPPVMFTEILLYFQTLMPGLAKNNGEGNEQVLPHMEANILIMGTANTKNNGRYNFQ